MPNLGNNFYNKLVKISQELGMRPEDILAVMASESGINPQAVEQQYKGSGLIGFMPDTLKNLGFKGQWNDFIKLKGEDQLDYVYRYIKDRMRLQGGRPFNSAAQYYVANFWPIALKLPGIQKEEPSTIFMEEHPETVQEPASKVLYSKKYYDIGQKIPASMESGAYKANPLFHGKVTGAITYGDMMRQVDKTRKGSTYQNAVAMMQNKTGYVSERPYSIPEKLDENFISSFLNKLQKLVGQFLSFATIKNNYLISIGSSDYYDAMEYARILSAALNEYLDARTSIYTDDSKIDIECNIRGDKNKILPALKELTEGVADAFKYATRDVGEITPFALVTADLKSRLDLLHPKRADLCYRRFKLKFVRKK